LNLETLPALRALLRVAGIVAAMDADEPGRKLRWSAAPPAATGTSRAATPAWWGAPWGDRRRHDRSRTKAQRPARQESEAKEPSPGRSSTSLALCRRAALKGQRRCPASLLTFYRTRLILLLMDNRSEVPYGALDLMVLKTLEAMGPLHGYGIARRIEQAAEEGLELNQGTIYPALLRLEQKGWISSEWGVSENNRRARFYAITRTGRKQLSLETENWARTVAMMKRLLEAQS
jgi:transcriptional regulator